jgi:hypothetical protein
MSSRNPPGQARAAKAERNAAIWEARNCEGPRLSMAALAALWGISRTRVQQIVKEEGLRRKRDQLG